MSGSRRSRGGDQIDGTGLPWFSTASLSMEPWMRSTRVLFRLRKVGAAGCGRVVAVAGGRGAGMKVLSEVKLCARSSEPMTWPSLRMRLPRPYAGTACRRWRDQQRIAQAEQNGRHQGEADGGGPDGVAGRCGGGVAEWLRSAW